jgi:hypothetical protein
MMIRFQIHEILFQERRRYAQSINLVFGAGDGHIDSRMCSVKPLVLEDDPISNSLNPFS